MFNDRWRGKGCQVLGRGIAVDLRTRPVGMPVEVVEFTFSHQVLDDVLKEVKKYLAPELFERIVTRIDEETGSLFIHVAP